MHGRVARLQKDFIHTLCKNLGQHAFHQKGSPVLTAQGRRDRNAAHMPPAALAVDCRRSCEHAVLLHAEPLRLLFRRDNIHFARDLLLVRKDLRRKRENSLHLRLFGAAHAAPHFSFAVLHPAFPLILQKRRKDCPLRLLFRLKCALMRGLRSLHRPEFRCGTYQRRALRTSRRAFHSRAQCSEPARPRSRPWPQGLR